MTMKDATPKQIHDAIYVLLKAGKITINQARTILGRDELKGGDFYLAKNDPHYSDALLEEAILKS
jgi:hypothetical protein